MFARSRSRRFVPAVDHLALRLAPSTILDPTLGGSTSCGGTADVSVPPSQASSSIPNDLDPMDPTIIDYTGGGSDDPMDPVPLGTQTLTVGPALYLP